MYIVPITEFTPIDSVESLDKVSAGLSGEQEGNHTESFSDVLMNAINGVREMEEKSQQDAYNLAMGKTDDIESIMIQSAKISTAIEITTQIVTRAVNSYKEIIQMQI